MDVYEFALTRRPAGFPPQFRRRRARRALETPAVPANIPPSPPPPCPPRARSTEGPNSSCRRRRRRCSFVPAVRLAAWEALKNQEDFGGQLIRSEMDVLTDQFVRTAPLGPATPAALAAAARCVGGWTALYVCTAHR